MSPIRALVAGSARDLEGWFEVLNATPDGRVGLEGPYVIEDVSSTDGVEGDRDVSAPGVTGAIERAGTAAS
jgi:hypothetical protein